MTTNISKLAAILAWLALAAIVFVTVSPIALRPHDLLPVEVDRALAFCLLSTLFVVAYPRYWIVVALATVLGAGAIEMLQAFSPSRHPRLDDALVKAAGACIGVLAGYAFNRLAGRLRTRNAVATVSG